MSLDHHDPVAIDAFAAEVDEELARNAPQSALWALIATWVVTGGILTLAQGVDAGWLYPLGLVGVVLWTVWVMRARRPG